MTSASPDLPLSVREDSYVTLHYRISLASGAGEGEVFTDTYTGRPATLQMGVGQWAPGMESCLVGHAEGESFSFTLAPVNAYGDRNPELIQRVTLAMLRENAGNEHFEPGDLVEFQAPNGGKYSGIFKEKGDTYAVFDFNHPLAGTALKVDVTLLGVM